MTQSGAWPLIHRYWAGFLGRDRFPLLCFSRCDRTLVEQKVFRGLGGFSASFVEGSFHSLRAQWLGIGCPVEWVWRWRNGGRRDGTEGRGAMRKSLPRISNPEDNHRISSYRIFVFSKSITESWKRDWDSGKNTVAFISRRPYISPGMSYKERSLNNQYCIFWFLGPIFFFHHFLSTHSDTVRNKPEWWDDIISTW